MKTPLVPNCFSENMLYAATQLKADSRTGTGFFFKFVFGEADFPVLVSCRHVVEGTYRWGFYVHEGRDTPLGVEPAGKVRYVDEDYVSGQERWIYHPDPKIDLAILPLGPLVSRHFSPPDAPAYIHYLSEGNLWTESRLQQLNVVEDILMVGCPIGQYDEINGFPLMRRGISSTHPSVDHRSEPHGLIDGPCFPGSSGSPLVISWDGLRFFKDGSIHQTDEWLSGVILGILSRHYTSGGTEPSAIPCNIDAAFELRFPAHLGVYVKARKLLDFKALLPT